jgi:hypothetical protein
MKTKVDLSIFAWPSTGMPLKTGALSMPLLAPSPSFFKHHGQFYNKPIPGCGPYSLTNKGIRMENLPVLDYPTTKYLLDSAGFQNTSPSDEDHQLFALLCIYVRESGNEPYKALGIALQKGLGGVYYRYRQPESLLEVDPVLVDSSKFGACYIRASFHDVVPNDEKRQLWIVRSFPETLGGFSLTETCVDETKEHDRHPAFILKELQIRQRLRFDPYERPFSKPGGILFSNVESGEIFAVIVGERKGQEWIDIAIDFEHKHLKGIVESYRAEEEAVGGYIPVTQPRNSKALDRASKSLNGGKEAHASIVRGVERGKRVFFVDVCIRVIQSVD